MRHKPARSVLKPDGGGKSEACFVFESLGSLATLCCAQVEGHFSRSSNAGATWPPNTFACSMTPLLSHFLISHLIHLTMFEHPQAASMENAFDIA
jgi:hypothetical protein